MGNVLVETCDIANGREFEEYRDILTAKSPIRAVGERIGLATSVRGLPIHRANGGLRIDIAGVRIAPLWMTWAAYSG